DNEGADELATNSNFQNFFRGLYIKAEPSSDEGVMVLLDIMSEDAGVYMYYQHERENRDGDTIKQPGSFKFNLGCHMVNLYDNENNTRTDDGEKLYVTSGQGSMSVIDPITDIEHPASLRTTD